MAKPSARRGISPSPPWFRASPQGQRHSRAGGRHMTFDELLAQVLDLLQREGRVSYRALKRRFALDDDYLEDLKAEIIEAQRLAVDEDGDVLLRTGDTGRSAAP